MKVLVLVTLLSATQAGTPPGSQNPPKSQPPPQQSGAAATGTSTPPPNLPTGVAAPADFVIGPNDVLTIVFWRDKDMSTDVSVRPDGKISLPLLNDVQAAGLTPEELRVQITAAAARLVEDPTVSVVVKEINSRKVFITGQVAKPGTYPLTGPTTVLQLIAMAGGVLEYADAKNITIMRTENGKPVSFSFNYKDVTKRKNLKQNIELKPGDTIIVP
jgi:polysaccharide export outer membrane protein